MTNWLKIPDNWLESDHVEQLGAEAVLFHLSALSYSCRQGTDGRVPLSALRRLWPVGDISTTVKALQEADEWQADGDAWYLPNWREHLLSKAELEHRRQVSRETSERYRRHKAGDHSLCERCSVVRARDASGDASVTSVVSQRLVSSRSEAREERRDEGGGAGARSARAPRPPRPPRVITEADGDAYDDTCTPWDVRVLTDDEPDQSGHSAVFAVPAMRREDDHNYTDEQLDAGYDFFRILAPSVVTEYGAAHAAVMARHCGHCQPDGIYWDPDAPELFLILPAPLAEAWVATIADAFSRRLKEVAA